MTESHHRPTVRRSNPCQSWRGKVASLMVSIGTVAIVVIATPKLRNSVPAEWFQSAVPLWMMMSLAITGTGLWLLRELTVEEASRSAPRRPRRFQSGVFYTRQDCPLCDEAYAILLDYEEELPPLQLVDIDTNPELIEKYGTWVPVLEIDGRERFRGRISEVLLRRLLRGTEMIEDEPDDSSTLG